MIVLGSTPELPFFGTYAHSDEYDARNALEHELIGGGIHINRDYKHNHVQSFIVGPNSQHYPLSQSDIHDCFVKNNLQSLPSIYRHKLKRQRTNYDE
jgi:hypothetical protein